jgi:hypothetical protein
MSEATGSVGNRRWLVLFIGLIALTAGCTFQYGIAYLIPALRHEGSRSSWPASSSRAPRPGCC